MLSSNYKRLEQLITRYAPNWGEILYLLDHYDDSKTVGDNMIMVAEAFGDKDKTGKSMWDRINRGIRKGSDDTIKDITELRKVI
jgi:hypothetical protein